MRRKSIVAVMVSCLVAGVTGYQVPAAAATTSAVVNALDCTQNPLNANDDNSTASVQLPFITGTDHIRVIK
jgi:hypothetical protein